MSAPAPKHEFAVYSKREAMGLKYDMLGTGAVVKMPSPHFKHGQLDTVEIRDYLRRHYPEADGAIASVEELSGVQYKFNYNRHKAQIGIWNISSVFDPTTTVIGASKISGKRH